MRELSEETLLVFVSDSHIGGDPGCDGFESPAELEALFEELGEREGPVELVLAGDFFDFLQLSDVGRETDRAAATISRPEYEALFAALARFRGEEGKQVIYLPGNHDAEVWWNPRVRQTLRERGLVDRFAYSYLASMETGGERRVVYCEHGNQLDPPNTIEDYTDRLDTPLGHHVVTDFTRRIAPLGEVARGLDLSEVKNVYPLVAIPHWVAGRYFYNLLAKAVSYLLLPLLATYVVYHTLAYLLSAAGRAPALPRINELFVEIVGFAFLILLIFGIFFLVVRRAVRRTLSNLDVGRRPRLPPAEASREKILTLLGGETPPPMNPSVVPARVDVFVSGHTHLPSLIQAERPDGGRAVVVNSGCWLRQLHPVAPYLDGPPVFVSEFVLTHVRVFVRDAELHVHLWEHPTPAEQHLSRIERLLSWGRRPAQPPPGSEPRVRASATVW
jgi:UDP-2,3-diacylglucosamine pyrophosphatase LpxH